MNQRRLTMFKPIASQEAALVEMQGQSPTLDWVSKVEAESEFKVEDLSKVADVDPHVQEE